MRQERGPLRARPLLRERFAWGRLYAGKRVHEVTTGKRVVIALGAPALPLIMAFRQDRITWQRGRNRRALLRALPWMIPMLIAWSVGEWVGIVTGRPTRARSGP